MPLGRSLKVLEVSQGARAELESLVCSRSLSTGLMRRRLGQQGGCRAGPTSRQTIGK